MVKFLLKLVYINTCASLYPLLFLKPPLLPSCPTFKHNFMLCFLCFKFLLLRNSSSPFNHMAFSAFLFLLNPFIFLVLFCNLVLTHSFYMSNLSQNIVFTLIIIYIHTHFKCLILHSTSIMFLPDIPNSHFYITKWEEACSYA